MRSQIDDTQSSQTKAELKSENDWLNSARNEVVEHAIEWKERKLTISEDDVIASLWEDEELRDHGGLWAQTVRPDSTERLQTTRSIGRVWLVFFVRSN